ncbi:MAG: hypothetical protein U0942_15805 [Parvibaculum sp.]|uniref:hypothetical protein n=1 Tax=Parvibaculum sp. TaxID=2024848 RepID=UPI002ABAA07A|nr:hypothetical protein [Parvibaculum sp.]MDZ4382796.1 hypothetical protein [Parvibaculum sp.]
MTNTHSFPVAWAPPFGSGPVFRDLRRPGQSIAEIVASVPGLPARFATRGVVCVNGEIVPRAMWAHVRPKPSSEIVPVAVTLHLPLAGGGGGSKGKNIFALVAAIALAIVTYGVSTGAIAGGLTGATAAGGATLASTALAAGIGLAGSLAIAALTAPPGLSGPGAAEGAASAERQSASLSGNMLQPGAAIPRVIGTHKIFPPFACEPLVTIDGDDEYVEAVYCLAGPHQLDDIRVNDAPVEESENVDYELREGRRGDAPISIVTRQGRTITPNIELSNIKVDPGDKSGNQLAHQSTPARDLPVWHTVVSREAPDEIHVHLQLIEGLYDSSAPDATVFLPVRIRFRKKGDSAWVNGPEFHIAESKPSRLNVSVNFKWESAPSPLPNPATDRGVIRAYKEVPAQTIVPAFDGWSADSYFSAGAGNDYLDVSTLGSSNVRNISIGSNDLTLYLDEGTFPKGRYEIQFKAGAAINETDFAKATYQTGGQVRSPFGYRLDSPMYRPADEQDKGRRCVLARVVSIWNEHPIAAKGLALIAIKAKNQSINSVSVRASGYVRDWDGSGWNDWTLSSNPAPHYADILSGRENIDPLPDDLRDDASIVAWRTDCATNGYECNMVVEGEGLDDTLRTVAACGYALKRQSEVWGVALDNDKSAEAPVQVFTPRNMADFKWTKAFARLPDGLRAVFRDEDSEYDEQEVIVYADGYAGGPDGRLEEIRYDGLTSRGLVEVRAGFDQAQARARSTFYSGKVSAEYLAATKGDLVAVQHDVLNRIAGAGRIKSVTLDEDEAFVTAIGLDSEIDIVNEPDMHAVTDMRAVADMRNVGVTTGIAVRRSDGATSVHALSNATGSSAALVLDTPAEAEEIDIDGTPVPAIAEGCLVASGPASKEYRRLIVFDIEPDTDLNAEITFIDEAPGLVRTAA